MPGVIATCVGYTQGRLEKPSYMQVRNRMLRCIQSSQCVTPCVTDRDCMTVVTQVCSGTTGHTEGIQLLYDPSVVTYDALCDKLLSTIDATALNRVGNDIGTQYRHGLYPHTDAQLDAATKAVEREQAKVGAGRKVVTEVQKATIFWPAEKYHRTRTHTRRTHPLMHTRRVSRRPEAPSTMHAHTHDVLHNERVCDRSNLVVQSGTSRRAASLLRRTRLHPCVATARATPSRCANRKGRTEKVEPKGELAVAHVFASRILSVRLRPELAETCPSTDGGEDGARMWCL